MYPVPSYPVGPIYVHLKPLCHTFPKNVFLSNFVKRGHSVPLSALILLISEPKLTSRPMPAKSPSLSLFPPLQVRRLRKTILCRLNSVVPKGQLGLHASVCLDVQSPQHEPHHRRRLCLLWNSKNIERSETERKTQNGRMEERDGRDQGLHSCVCVDGTYMHLHGPGNGYQVCCWHRLDIVTQHESLLRERGKRWGRFAPSLSRVENIKIQEETVRLLAES